MKWEICPWCGRAFIKHYRQVYCQPECRRKFGKMLNTLEQEREIRIANELNNANWSHL